ncbi:MAG: hypothetical protein LBQ66_12805 [Planctomycetaceae bacterium]|nr:hypothetical protein [Planctomycetaceae bacterium]
MGVLVLSMRVPPPLFSACSARRKRNRPAVGYPPYDHRPAVGYPPYVCQHVLVFSSNLFGSIMHRGGRDARVPVRRRFAAIVGVLVLPMLFPPHLVGSKLPSLTSREYVYDLCGITSGSFVIGGE